MAGGVGGGGPGGGGKLHNPGRRIVGGLGPDMATLFRGYRAPPTNLSDFAKKGWPEKNNMSPPKIEKNPPPPPKKKLAQNNG